jgi:hypothetical protein
MGLDTLFRAVEHFMGQRVESVFEVTGFELDKIYGYKSLSGPMVSNMLYTFEIAGGKTKIRMSAQIYPGDLLTSSVHTAEKTQETIPGKPGPLKEPSGSRPGGALAVIPCS